jgi:hypothetical protein
MNEGLVADEVKIVGLIWRPAPREGGVTSQTVPDWA